ncbi:MAG: sensor histidine kinase [Cyanophyceae cyanobacterium]
MITSIGNVLTLEHLEDYHCTPTLLDLNQFCRQFILDLQTKEELQQEIEFTQIHPLIPANWPSGDSQTLTSTTEASRQSPVSSSDAPAAAHNNLGAWLCLDKHLVAIILNNLLINASHFSRRSTTIYLDLDCEHEEVIFRVHDRGLGIPSRDRLRLFEPYCRGSNTQNFGLGVGLALVKHCVNLHRGTIVIESEEGAGTTVIVRLPSSGLIPESES